MKKIPGYENYSATEDGQIYSHLSNKFLKQSPKNKYGHLAVWLNGKTIHTHVLILLTFCGDRPSSMVSRHIDGNRVNNKIANLEYGTQKQNCQDKKRHGTWQSCENGPSSKITKEAASDIRYNYIGRVAGKTKSNARYFMDKYNLSQGSVWNIAHGKSWKEIDVTRT